MSAPLLFCSRVFFYERPGQGHGPGDERPPEQDVQYQDRNDLPVLADNSYYSRQEYKSKPQHAEYDEKRDDHE